MIAFCIPSRGLIYSRTVQTVIEGIYALQEKGISSIYCCSHDLPIPDCHNQCVEQALAHKEVDTLVFIEEDHYIEPAALVALATNEADITTLQYNDKNGSPHGIIHYNEAGDILWAGLGATAIKRQVFATLGEPYFRTDTLYKVTKKHLKDEKLITEYEPLTRRQEWNGKQFDDIIDHYQYGGLDVDFYTRARQAGFTVRKLEQYKAHHFELVQLGEKYTNNGVHVIKQV